MSQQIKTSSLGMFRSEFALQPEDLNTGLQARVVECPGLYVTLVFQVVKVGVEVAGQRAVLVKSLATGHEMPVFLEQIGIIPDKEGKFNSPFVTVARSNLESVMRRFKKKPAGVTR